MTGLSVMFFASDAGRSAAEGYRLVLDTAGIADECGYDAVWTPERHFHRFGGLFPNPAVLGAAIAATTKRIGIRGGSVIAPLHDVLRIAEEWAEVDAISGGRVGVSLGSGWNAADFALAPDRYADRHRLTVQRLAELRALWRGEPVTRISGGGEPVEITTYPRPVQPDLPVWLTASSNPDTFRAAGRAGANVLTHLLGQDTAALAEKVGLYRQERRQAGPGAGTVSVMVHASLGADDTSAAASARRPLSAYLRDAASLELRAAAAGGTVSGGKSVKAASVSAALLDQVVADRFLGICSGTSLVGGPDRCRRVLAELAAIGVDDVACLVDFGMPADAIADTVRGLADLAGLSVTSGTGTRQRPDADR